jgi:branched-chain amino acid aminotransferase
MYFKSLFLQKTSQIMHFSYFNGQVLLVDQTALGIKDLAILRGYGLFDYFRTYNGRPFQWDLYWKRFQNSAASLLLTIPLPKDEIYAIVLELIKKQGGGDCAIRFLLTGGYAEDSINASEPNFVILTEDIHHVSEATYLAGISVLSYAYVRDLPHVKSIDYKHLIMAQPALKNANAQDIMYHVNGDVSELSRSNVFMVKGQKLYTPKHNILNGITRQVVIELARTDFEIIETDISLAELLIADEIFTTSSTKKILAITQIDQHKIGSGIMGPKTSLLLQKFNDLIQNW